MLSYFETEIKGELTNTSDEDKKKVECLLDFLTNTKFHKVLSRSKDITILEVPFELRGFLQSIITDVRMNKGLVVPSFGIVKLDEQTLEKYKAEIEKLWNEDC
jgi:hypothetical protein